MALREAPLHLPQCRIRCDCSELPAVVLELERCPCYLSKTSFDPCSHRPRASGSPPPDRGFRSLTSWGLLDGFRVFGRFGAVEASEGVGYREGFAVQEATDARGLLIKHRCDAVLPMLTSA